MAEAAALYLDLLKRCLMGMQSAEEWVPVAPRSRSSRLVSAALTPVLRHRGLEVGRRVSVPLDQRREGRDWPRHGETMIGIHRLTNLQSCVVDVIRNGVPGDVIETGVWKGGACILMRAVLEAYGDRDRCVWVADSFRGLPPPDVATYPDDEAVQLWVYPELAITVDQVRANFAKYGLLDERVRFLEGWFKDTLTTAPIERLAVLRLDGDLYESTIQALTALYPKLSEGGYVIVDDYGAVPACRKAVDDFRAAQSITAPLETIDWTGVYWQRTQRPRPS